MSYLATLPNYCFNNGNQMNQLLNHYVLNQNFIATKNVLAHLQSALKISVLNYQQNYQPNLASPCQEQVSSKTQPVTQEKQPKSLETLQCREENKEVQSNNKEVEKQIIVIVEPILLETQHRKESQGQTDDEILLEEKEKTAKKTQPIKKRGKKVKADSTIDFVVPIPKVDLIETAYLPLFPLHPTEILKKREDILNRKVAECTGFIKSRKEKREIRMLGN